MIMNMTIRKKLIGPMGLVLIISAAVVGVSNCYTLQRS